MIRELGYFVDEIRKNWKEEWWRQRRLRQRVVIPVHKLLTPNPNGLDVMNESWDNLLILDACRDDLFEDAASLDEFDTYRTVTSGGSGTPEWVRYNFGDGEFGDTVYITANPWPVKLVSDSFHRMVDVSEGWEDGEVTADVVADAARQAFDEFPNKRIIVHFMQPHGPFVVDTDLPSPIANVNQALNNGSISKSDVHEAFKKNLEHALEPALELSEYMTGKTVISSDHGNMFGERAWPVPLKFYGHSPGVRSPQLNRVPWAEIDSETRREITNEGVSQVADSENKELKKRLVALGYGEMVF
jgi:hypothetical protein